MILTKSMSIAAHEYSMKPQYHVYWMSFCWYKMSNLCYITVKNQICIDKDYILTYVYFQYNKIKELDLKNDVLCMIFKIILKK